MHRRQMARFGALLFGGGAAVTALGLVLPHLPQVDDAGLAAVAAGAALLAVALVVSGERLPLWAFQLVATRRHGVRVARAAFQRRAQRRSGRRRRDVLPVGSPLRRVLLRPDRNGSTGGRDRPGLCRHADRDRSRADRGQQMAQHGRAGGRIGCRRPPAQRPRCEAGRQSRAGGPHRSPDRHAEPTRVRGAVRPSGVYRPSHQPAVRPAARGSRPFQGAQRPPGARGGRCRARRARPSVHRGAERTRSGRTCGRRRVRGAAARNRPRRRPGDRGSNRPGRFRTVACARSSGDAQLRCRDVRRGRAYPRRPHKGGGRGAVHGEANGPLGMRATAAVG